MAVISRRGYWEVANSGMSENKPAITLSQVRPKYQKSREITRIAKPPVDVGVLSAIATCEACGRVWISRERGPRELADVGNFQTSIGNLRIKCPGCGLVADVPTLGLV